MQINPCGYFILQSTSPLVGSGCLPDLQVYSQGVLNPASLLSESPRIGNAEFPSLFKGRGLRLSPGQRTRIKKTGVSTQLSNKREHTHAVSAHSVCSGCSLSTLSVTCYQPGSENIKWNIPEKNGTVTVNTFYSQYSV